MNRVSYWSQHKQLAVKIISAARHYCQLCHIIVGSRPSIEPKFVSTTHSSLKLQRAMSVELDVCDSLYSTSSPTVNFTSVPLRMFSAKKLLNKVYGIWSSKWLLRNLAQSSNILLTWSHCSIFAHWMHHHMVYCTQSQSYKLLRINGSHFNSRQIYKCSLVNHLVTILCSVFHTLSRSW